MASNNLGYYSSKGAVHRMSDVNQNRWEWEPQRTNNFEVQIFVEDILRRSSNSRNINLGTVVRDLMLSVANFNAPQANVSTIGVSYGNNTAKFAGVPTYADSSITFNDFIGLDVENIIYAWHSLVYDPVTEVVGQAKNYKTKANLVEYSPDGTLYRQWEMHGVWLSEFQLGSYAQDNNSVRQITGTLIYDYIVPGESNR